MRRVRIVVVVVAVLTVMVMAAEIVARFSVSEQLATRAPVGVDLRLNGPVLPGLISGAVPVTAEIDARALARLGDDAEVQIEDSVQVTTQRQTALGSLPVTIELEPTVTDGRVVFTMSSATAAGIELSDRQRAKLADKLGVLSFGWQCLHATDARIEDHRVVVDAAVPIRADGSARCP